MSKIDLRNGEDVNLIYNLRETFYFSFSVADQDGAAVDLSAKTVVFSIRLTDSGDAIATATAGSGLTVSTSTVTINKTFTGLSAKVYHYDIMNTTDNRCIADGRLIINYGGQ
jgi:hypothetical protein